MKTFAASLLVAIALPVAGLRAQPIVTNAAVSVHAVVTDPLSLSFGADGALYTGRDNSGSGGGYGDAVKIHRIAPGGSPVGEFGVAPLGDPDVAIVDVAGIVSGIPGAVLVGGDAVGTGWGVISRIAPDGSITVFLGPSTEYGNPSAFAFDPEGRLLFVTYTNGRMYRTDGGTPRLLFSFPHMNSVAVDSLGRIAANSADDTRLRLYLPDGTLANGTFATVVAGTPLARGPGGAWGTDLYAVGGGGALLRIATDGTTKTVGSGFAPVRGLAFGPDGALYASDFNGDRVYRFGLPDVGGARTTVYARVTDPVRLSFAPDGTLYVGRDKFGSGGDHSDAVKIHRIGPGGTPVEEFGNTAISDPDGVYYDATGQFTGTPGTVLVGGVEYLANTGKLSGILPDGTVGTTYGPTKFGFNPNVFVHDAVGGRLLFSDDIGGRVWSMNGTAPEVLFSLPQAFPLAVDALGRIIAGANDTSLRLYSATGTLLAANFASAEVGTPMARGPGGFWGTDVYFVGTDYNLMRVDTNGVATRAGSGFGGLAALAFGPDGALYASHLENDIIWRVAPVDERPRLVGTRDGAAVRLSWESVAARVYQLQSATRLSPPDWSDEGLPFAGTGGLLATNLPSGPEPERFFRLRVAN